MIKDVLYLSYDGLTDPLGQSQVLPYLLEAQKYTNVVVISAEKSSHYAQNKNVIENILRGTKIKWYPTVYHKFPPVLSTLFDIWTIHFKAKQLLKKRKYIVHCRSYIAALVGLRLKKKFKVPFVFDMRGFWADERIDGGIWNLANPIFKAIYGYFKAKEKEFLSEADAVISLTHDGKKELMKTFGITESKITVIPCCVDLNLFKPQSTSNQELRSTLNIKEDQLVLTYLGSIGTWYLLDDMLEFFLALKQHKNETVMLFVTHENPDSITKAAKKIGLEEQDLRIVSAQRKDVPNYLEISDIGFFMIKECYSKIASSPTKMGEYLSMGLPVVGNGGIGDVAHTIEQFNCGLSLEKFGQTYYESVMPAVDKMLELPKTNMHKAAQDYFSLDSGAASYRKVYEQLSQSW